MSVNGNNNVLIGAGATLPDAYASNQIVLGTAAETTFVGGAPATGVTLSAGGVAIAAGGRLRVVAPASTSTLDSNSITTRNITAASLQATEITASTSANLQTITSDEAKIDAINTISFSATSACNCGTVTGATSISAIAANVSVSATSISATTLNANSITTKSLSANTITATTIKDTLPYRIVDLSQYYNNNVYNLSAVCNKNGTFFLQNATGPGPVIIPDPTSVPLGCRINIMLQVSTATPQSPVTGVQAFSRVFIPRPAPPGILTNGLSTSNDMSTVFTYFPTGGTSSGTSTIKQNSFRLIAVGLPQGARYWYEL